MGAIVEVIKPYIGMIFAIWFISEVITAMRRRETLYINDAGRLVCSFKLSNDARPHGMNVVSIGLASCNVSVKTRLLCSQETFWGRISQIGTKAPSSLSTSSGL